MCTEEFERYIASLFDRIKRKDPSDSYLCIPVLNHENQTVGLLKPVCFDYKDMFPGCIFLLSKWRRENPSLSNSVFEVTDARTEKWLENLVLARPDRILFFIDELDGTHIGHIAYSSFDFENKTAEIDAVLRGRSSTVRGLMTFAVRAMVRWAEKYLNLNCIQLRVSDGNERAVSLYQRCGFRCISKIPLFRRELEGETRWDEDKMRNPSEAERYEILMRYEGDMENGRQV